MSSKCQRKVLKSMTQVHSCCFAQKTNSFLMLSLSSLAWLLKLPNNSWATDNVTRGPFARKYFQFASLFVQTPTQATRKRKHFDNITFQENKYPFFKIKFLLIIRLVCSSDYLVTFNILTGQNGEVTKLKFLCPVNSLRYILSPV